MHRRHRPVLDRDKFVRNRVGKLEVFALFTEPLQRIFCRFRIFFFITAFAIEADYTVKRVLGIYCLVSLCLLERSIAESESRILSTLVVFRHSPG